MAQPVSSSKQLPTGVSPPNWCHTVCNVVKTEFVWKIQQFELLQGPRSQLESAKFSVTDKGIVFMTWSLILDDEEILLRQHFPAGKVASRSTRVNTAFVNAKGVKELSQEVYVYQISEMPKLVNALCTRYSLVQKHLIVDGNLTIFCQVETYMNKQNLTGQTAVGASQLFSNKEELLKDFQDLFEDKKHCDVTFNVRDQEFPAHKNILAARSQVFSAMFDHPSKENLKGIVDIPDIEPEVFKELLRYIYTGDVPLERLDEVAVGLLAAADKYLLEKLKKACKKHLTDRISPENCIKLLSLDEHDAAYCLKEKAVDYIRKYPAQVVATDEWKKANEEKTEWFLNIKDMLFDSLFLQSKGGK